MKLLLFSTRYRRFYLVFLMTLAMALLTWDNHFSLSSTVTPRRRTSETICKGSSLETNLWQWTSVCVDRSHENCIFCLWSSLLVQELCLVIIISRLRGQNGILLCWFYLSSLLYSSETWHSSYSWVAPKQTATYFWISACSSITCWNKYFCCFFQLCPAIN